MSEMKSAEYRYGKASPPDYWIVEVSGGDFAGMVFMFTDWKIAKHQDKDELTGGVMSEMMRLTFDFRSDDPRADRENREVLSMMGNILLDILTKEAELKQPTLE